jgi:hypothetical protein
MHSLYKMTALGVLAATVCGCAPAMTQHPAQLSWAFEARPTWGEVRVLPVLALHDDVPVNLESYVGAPLPEVQQRQRRRRTWEMQSLVPTSVGWSLPGEINGALGHSWAGQFQSARFPTGSVDRLRTALDGQRDLDEALGTVARSVGGNATLFCWVREVSGEPLSLKGFPGDVLHTSVGSRVLDYSGDEPYLVTAQVGMALVASDGQVLVRYEDRFTGMLEGVDQVHRTGRELARALAEEVTKVWAVDPRLLEHEPGAPAPSEPPEERGRTLRPTRDLGPTAFAPPVP